MLEIETTTSEAETQKPLRPRAFAAPLMVLVLASVIGIAVDTVALHQPPGVGLAIGLVAALAVVASATWLMGEMPRGPVVSVAIAGIVLASFVAIRSSAILLSLNLVGVLIAFSALIALQTGLRRGWTVASYLLLVPGAVAELSAGAADFVRADLPGSVAEEQRRRIRAVMVGLVLGVPLVAVFTVLFASADAGFSAYLDAVFSNITFGSTLSRVLGTGLVTLFVLGLWRSVRKPIGAVGDAIARSHGGLAPTSAVTVLALLVGLFALFVVTQVLGHNPDLVTHADFRANARRGFFELVTVAGLVLTTLLAFDWLTRGDGAVRSRTFDRLAVSLIILTGFVQVSAMSRMIRYVTENGLTQRRFFTSVFMVWLAFVLFWFTLTILRNRHVRFAFGLVVSAFVVTVGLNLANPDSLIAEANFDRHLAGRGFDQHNQRLSVDAAPVLVRVVDEGPDTYCTLAVRLETMHDELTLDREQDGWLGTTLADVRARQLLADVDPDSECEEES